MVAWLAAFAAGVLLAAVQYARQGRATLAALPAALLRGAAALLTAALALDAPAGSARPMRPFVALDVSASWLRTGDSAAWRAALDSARSAHGDSTFLFGDSLRPRVGTPTPADRASRAAPAVERALGVGRPLVVVTDGELTDPDALASLPAGSRVVVVPRAARPDAAVSEIDAPRALVDGDTVEARVTITAGAAGAPGSTVTLTLDGRPVARAETEALGPYAERALALRGRAAAPRVGPALLRAIVTAPRDAEARNDTLAVGVVVARGAGAVFVSTAPDEDARFALAVLRGAVSIPARGYYRVAPGAWRAEGTLGAVSEGEVRRALADAPLVILHGDTALFGAPRRVTNGALALVPAPIPDDGEWYASDAPPSPLSAALAGLPWDSLPPADASPAQPRGEWVGLEMRRGRSGERRAVIAGTEGARRAVVVTASGLWRWRFRGGVSADAYAALWGGLFDWLAAGRGDVRSIVPDGVVIREGDPIRWRRGGSTDSVVHVRLSPRARGSPAASLTVRFAPGATIAETPPLPRGIYDVTAPGGQAVVAVNASAEWLPRGPRVRSGGTRGPRPAGGTPTLRSVRWVYALVIVLLCLEWLIRRRRGMR